MNCSLTVLLRTPFSTDELLFLQLEERGDQKFKIQWSKKCMTVNASKGSGEECLEINSQVHPALTTCPFLVLQLTLAHCMLLDLLFQQSCTSALNLSLWHTQIKILRPCKEEGKKSSQDLTAYLNGPFAFGWSITNRPKERLHTLYLTFPHPIPFSKTLRSAEGRKATSTR